MMYVYFLKLSNGNIYKGSTDNLDRRLQEHQEGKSDSTRPHLPCTLIGYEVYQHRSDALRREQFLKTTEGIKLLKRQYKDAIDQGSEILDLEILRS